MVSLEESEVLHSVRMDSGLFMQVHRAVEIMPLVGLSNSGTSFSKKRLVYYLAIQPYLYWPRCWHLVLMAASLPYSQVVWSSWTSLQERLLVHSIQAHKLVHHLPE